MQHSGRIIGFVGSRLRRIGDDNGRLEYSVLLAVLDVDADSVRSDFVREERNRPVHGGAYEVSVGDDHDAPAAAVGFFHKALD